MISYQKAVAVRERVARAAGIDAQDIIDRGRSRQAVVARMVLAGLMRRAGWSYPAIGRLLRRDHATALYLCRQLDGALAVGRGYEDVVGLWNECENFVNI